MSTKSLSREEAAQLYQDLQKAMGTIKSKKMTGKAVSKEEYLQDDIAPSMMLSATLPSISPRSVMTFVLLLAIARAVLSGLDVIGVTSVDAAMAVAMNAPTAQISLQDGLSRDEVRILTTLDARRVELEQRAKKQELKDAELKNQEKELMAKFIELKAMTEKLSDDRSKTDVKKAAQIEQLANVYGSMGPSEAAALIEQLDMTIALDLIAKMPEKRIGQILSLMSKEKALEITKLLSSSRK